MHQIQPILYISLRSPFARRIRLALHRLGVSYQEKVLNVFLENPDLMQANPLGLVPTLITQHGPITDSANILEYLNEAYGGIWPKDLNTRIESRQASLWAAGVMQSLVQYYQETKMHEVPSPHWAKEHAESILNTLSTLSNAPERVWLSNAPGSEGFTQAGWDLCVALEYMDLRLPELNWREKYPGFVSILERARKNSYFCETTPPV